MRRVLVVASYVLVIAAVLLLIDDIGVWWPAHPGLHACYTNAYATYGPDGVHACPVSGAFPWWQAVADVLAIALVAMFLGLELRGGRPGPAR